MITKIFVIFAVIGTLGRTAAIGIESYAKYTNASKSMEPSPSSNNKITGWNKNQLNEEYMKSITKKQCSVKTSLSVEQCKTKQCYINLAGIEGDCAVFAQGEMKEYCDITNHYINHYCSVLSDKKEACALFRIGAKINCSNI